MAVKRLSPALALLLALPSAGFALGLGDIHLLSALNAPLDAEIEIIDVAPDETNTVQAGLASRDTFAKNGLDWPSLMSNVSVKTQRTPDGRQVIKLRSNDPVSDPFLTFLVEVNWSHGHLVREFTVLLDPPVYAPQSQVAAAPVAAPSAGAETHAGSIARTPEPAAPPPTPAEAPPATAPARTARNADNEGAGAAPGAGGSRTVHPGDTLSRIAANVAGADATTPRARSWMVAIYQANPQAFEQNMNLLRAGSVLRIPDAATVQAISPADALATIRSQTAAWRGSSTAASGSAPSTPAAQQPGRLKLVPPSQGGATAGVTAGSPGSEVSALQGRVKDLEGQLAEQKRLLDLKNADLARAQAQLAAKQGNAPAPEPTPAPAPATPPPSAQAPAPQAAPPAPAPEETKPAPAPVPETPPVAQKPPAVQPAPSVQTTPSGGIGETLKHYWWALLLLLAAILALVFTRVMGKRRESEFDDSFGKLTGGGGDFAPAPRPVAPAPVPARPAAAGPDQAFLVEETGSHERPRIGLGGAAAAPRHVASDETISSETAINLDQGDPLAEADFHMAYGLYDQAADLIRIAIAREPNRRDLKLKLLEVFFVWGNKEQFLQTARELAETRAQAAPGEWEKILIMGKQLAPEDPLFSGAGGITGAAAGGVDLDLEGGQSRVDFELLGEPTSSEHGLDLDIGSAADASSESPTNVTDRNEALEGFGTAQTGSTRQMTQRMSPKLGEFEGPTVEQPALGGTDNPTVRQKVQTALRHTSPAEQTAELAIDDLGLDMDVGQVDTVDQPGIHSEAASNPDSPTLVTGLDDAARARVGRDSGASGAWSFDQTELEQALTQTTLGVQDPSATSRLAALKDHAVDVDVGESTGVHEMHEMPSADHVDLDVGEATGAHPAPGALDLDVGAETTPDASFAQTQKLSTEDLALPDLEPVTMSEVGTKLDLARAYMDMGDPDGARNILEEVLHEGSAAQKQEAQRLMESLPG